MQKADYLNVVTASYLLCLSENNARYMHYTQRHMHKTHTPAYILYIRYPRTHAHIHSITAHIM